MVKLEHTIKDLITFYIKENYNKYLKDNNLTQIDSDKIFSVISFSTAKRVFAQTSIPPICA